jgi:uncharacterized membrane protein YfhO
VSGGGVRLVKETANRIELDVDAPGNALLSTADVYYPAWRVLIDGKPGEVIPANLLFRAVAVPKGKHRVTFVFHSDKATRGLLVSLGALAAIGAGFATRKRIQRIACGG